MKELIGKTVSSVETSVGNKPGYITLEPSDPSGAATPSQHLRIPISALVDIGAVQHLLEEEGIVFLTGVTSEADLVAFAERFGTIYHHRDSDHTGVTYITKKSNVGSRGGYRAFSSSALALHTDRSAAPSPPSLLLMACNQSASSGGISTFADGRSILLDINKRDPSIAKLLVEAPSCIFKDTENTYVGPMFESMAENRLALRFRYDSGGYFSSELSDKLPLILEALRRHTRQCLLEKGEGVLLNNRRWLHGRTAFTGSRVVWRVLAHRPSLDGFRISNP